MGEAIVSLVDVEKRFGTNLVVKKMNLEIEEGEFLTLLGPSGCGKTTTLRMVAGFEDASAGIIKVQGERVEDKEPYQRDVNTVFQNYALFPHMTVYDNVAYGLTIKKVPKDEIRKRVMEMLQLVQLGGYEKRKPDELSGGQKQRVAKFLPRICGRYNIIDTKDYELKGISPQYRGYISHLVMHAVTQRIDAHMEYLNCHPMEIRRYYRRLDY